MWNEKEIEKAAWGYENYYGDVKYDAFMAGARFVLDKIKSANNLEISE